MRKKLSVILLVLFSLVGVFSFVACEQKTKCPSCGSENIETAEALGVTAHICLDCGWSW